MWRPMWPDLPADQIPVRSITNGVHVPTWMAGSVFELLEPALRSGLARPGGRPGVVGAAARHSRRRHLGHAQRDAHATCSRSSASGCGRAGSDEHVSPSRIVAAGSMLDPERADPRLRAPLHRLQAARADLPRPRSAGAHSQRHRPAGADRVRRQGAPGRRAGQASPAARLPARARSEVRRPPGLHRRLRHAPRPLPGARLRRVAEQPAQAARGQRHQRHEGGAQRRAAPEHRRRLVGRRLQRQERLADREP